jgi:hypothetical protein
MTLTTIASGRRLAHPRIGEFRLELLDLLFRCLDFLLSVGNLKTHSAVQIEIEVGDEDEREEANEVAAPTREQKVVARNYDEKERDPMAEAVFAGEEVKKLAGQQRAASLAPALTKFPWLAKNFLKHHGPRNAGDRNRQDKKPRNLLPAYFHTHKLRAKVVPRCSPRDAFTISAQRPARLSTAQLVAGSCRPHSLCRHSPL